MNQFGSEATQSLTSSRHAPTILKPIVRSIVPSRADFCFVHLADGDLLRCVVSEHATPEGQRVVTELGRVYRILRGDPESTVAQVVRSGRPQVRSEIAVDNGSRVTPRIAHVHRLLAPRSAIVVPLVLRGMVIGALTLGYAGSDRRYTAHDVGGVTRLAKRMANWLADAHPADAATKVLARPAAGSTRRLPLRARV